MWSYPYRYKDRYTLSSFAPWMKKEKNLQNFGERKCILRDLRDVPVCFLECVENKAEGKSYKWRRATGVQGGMGDDRTVRLPEKKFTILNPDNFLCINFTLISLSYLEES